MLDSVFYRTLFLYMRLLQTGIPRSGNYWVYTIVQRLLQASGVEVSRWITRQDLSGLEFQENFAGQRQVDALSLNPLTGEYFWRVSSVYKQPIVDLDKYLRAVTHLWTHAPYTEALRPITRERSHRLYVLRDLRDVLVSMSHFRGRKQGITPEAYLAAHLEADTRHWVDHVRSYEGASEEFLWIRYEDLLRDLPGQVRRIQQYLGLALPTSALDTLVSAVEFDTLQRLSPRHLRTGVSGAGEFTLTPAQLQIIMRLAGEQLRTLAYV